MAIPKKKEIASFASLDTPKKSSQRLVERPNPNIPIKPITAATAAIINLCIAFYCVLQYKWDYSAPVRLLIKQFRH